MVVSGGWNTTFGSIIGGPGITIVDGGDRGRVFDVPSLTLGSLTLRNLTLRDGLSCAREVRTASRWAPGSAPSSSARRR